MCGVTDKLRPDGDAKILPGGERMADVSFFMFIYIKQSKEHASRNHRSGGGL